MPLLPLPPGNLTPAGGVLPVSSVADVLAVFPADMSTSDPAPVRDGLLTALTAMMLRYQERASYAAAQADAGWATGIYEDGLLSDRGFDRQPGESDLAYRTRAFATPSNVTRADILTVVNAALAPYTTYHAQLFDSVTDRMFLTNGAVTNFHSFIGATPQYLERLYPDDSALNGGVVLPQNDPGASWVFGDANGRYFVLRVPELTSADLAHAYAFDAIDPNGNPILDGTGFAIEVGFGRNLGLYIADGTNTGGAELDGSVTTFCYAGLDTAIAVYQAISNAVERMKGHGIRWQLFADPLLTT